LPDDHFIDLGTQIMQKHAFSLGDGVHFTDGGQVHL